MLIEFVFDFVVSGLSKLGDIVVVVLLLIIVIFDDVIYLKYFESYGWYVFVDDGVNIIMSVGFDLDGNCLVVVLFDYKFGFIFGDMCIWLII